MKIKIIHENKKKEIQLEKKITISELAKRLNIVMPNYIVKLNNKIVPEDEILNNGDTVEFFKVISGG